MKWLSRSLRRQLVRAAALLLLALTVYAPAAGALRALLGGDSLRAFRAARAGERGAAEPTAALATLTAGPPPPARPTLVWVLLGEPFFQDYFLESITQARVFNPASDFILVGNLELLSPWAAPLAALRVTLVSERSVETDFSRNFTNTFLNLWWVQLAGRVGKLEPSMKHRSNMNFSQLTLTRLVALHELMAARGLERVVHVENDQMLYGPIDALADATDGCGARFAMSRVGARFAPAVVYARDAAALGDLVAFLYDSISRGGDHAVAVSQTTWVTDMALTAAYFRATKAAGRTDAVALPITPDGACVNARSGFFYDGAGLGVWCCGSFQYPRKHFEMRLEESEARYWELPFNWTLVDGLRVPLWNGSRAFNLHVHSKHLHLWRSTDKELDAEAVAKVPEHH